VEQPLISVLAVFGAERSRNIPLLNALARQTIGGRMELVLVDVAPANAPSLDLPDGIDCRIIRRPGSWDWGAARAADVRAAGAPLVAFLEDHTVPSDRWAEEVLEQFERSDPDTTAICYAFTNGSPDTWFYRSVFMAEYGALAHPMDEGSPPSATANNIAYRRSALLELGEKLDDLLELDFFLQNHLGDRFKAVSAPRAILAHQTNSRLRDLVTGHFGYARLFASRRIRHEGWSMPKRLLGAVSVPILVPAIRLGRLFGALPGRGLAWDVVFGLPVIALLYLAGAAGESAGLLEGGAHSARDVVWLELEAPRELK